METVYIMKWSLRSEVYGSCYSNIYSVEKNFSVLQWKDVGEMHSVCIYLNLCISDSS